MTAEELLNAAQAQGLTLVADGTQLRIRPGSRLTPELLTHLRARKSELIDLLTWPEECLAAEREHGHPCARLFPLIGGQVSTSMGQGRLIEALPERAVVILDRRPDRFAVLLPAEVGPPDATLRGDTFPTIKN